MTNLVKKQNQLPSTSYTLATAVADFRLLERAERGRDFIVDLIKNDINEFIAQANDLLIVDADNGQWLRDWVNNHIVKRDGQYNKLLPIGTTIGKGSELAPLAIKQKSKAEIDKQAVQDQTAKLLLSIVNMDKRKELALLPDRDLKKSQAKLTAVQQAIAKQKEDSIALIALNNAKLEITKALKLVPDGEFKTAASARVLNTVEDCKVLGDEINAFLKTDAKDPIVQVPKGTLEQPRDKPQGVSKVSPDATISKESAQTVQKTFDTLVNKLSIIELRELSLKIQGFLVDELDQASNG